MKKSELRGMIKEALLSFNYKDRMEGLANTQDLIVLKTKLRILTSNWVNEGFELEDIKRYIIDFIDTI